MIFDAIIFENVKILVNFRQFWSILMIFDAICVHMYAYVCVGCSSQNSPEGKLGIPEGPRKFPEGFPGSLVFGGAYCKRLFDAPHIDHPHTICLAAVGCILYMA